MKNHNRTAVLTVSTTKPGWATNGAIWREKSKLVKAGGKNLPVTEPPPGEDCTVSVRRNALVVSAP